MAIFQLWYKENKNSRKWKQSSLSMLNKEALEVQGGLLKKQEGWEDVKVMPEDKNPNESLSKANKFIKVISEAEERDSVAIAQVADNFTRFLVGDSDIALKRLAELKHSVKTPSYFKGGGKDYNNVYDDVLKAMVKAINKIYV
jgi:hypothetical protein